MKHLLLKDLWTDQTRPAGASRTAFNAGENKSSPAESSRIIAVIAVRFRRLRRNAYEFGANGVRPPTRHREAESSLQEQGHDVDCSDRDSGETTTGWHDTIMTDAASSPLSRPPTRPCDIVPAPLRPCGVSNTERFHSLTMTCDTTHSALHYQFIHFQQLR